MVHQTFDPAQQIAPPQLAPPGAGIPWRRRMLMTYVVRPFVAARSDWLENARGFAALTAKILRDVEGLTPEQMRTKVLVPPQAGLEDSSRFWSIAMALEHLVIVGSQIERLIGELSMGRAPAVKVDTAKLKPLGEAEPEAALRGFRDWAVGAEQRILTVSRSQVSNVTLVHPWFGEFNSLQWQWLLTQHQAIHLKQIRAIKEGLVIGR